MTEREWLTCDNPQRMVGILTHRLTETDAMWPAGYLPSDRKLRLFCCACARQVWDQLTDERSRHAVEVAERFADGLATEAEIMTAWRRNPGVVQSRHHPAGMAAYAAWFQRELNDMGYALSRVAGSNAVPNSTQSALLREIIGNLSRPVFLFREYVEGNERVVDFDKDRNAEALEQYRQWKSWMRWSDGTIRRMALDIYDRRDYGLMPILADALEDAGCPSEVCEHNPSHRRTKSEYSMCAECGCWRVTHPILHHLRSPGPHVRGCWALDLMLGKE